MSDVEQERQKPQLVNVPLEWHVSDSIQSKYVTNLLVQAGQNELFVSFFEAQVPILTGTAEENSARLRQLDAIKAECVGRIVVSPDLVPNIIKALQTGLDAYCLSKEVQQEEVK